MKIHIHFNNNRTQVCQLNEELKVGQTATIHFHDEPNDCEICPNGHCHAPNISVVRVDEDSLFVNLENLAMPLKCDVKDLPQHDSMVH